MRFLALPVVEGSSLREGVVISIGVDFIEVVIETELISGESKEKVPREQHLEPEG